MAVQHSHVLTNMVKNPLCHLVISPGGYSGILVKRRCKEFFGFDSHSLGLSGVSIFLVDSFDRNVLAKAYALSGGGGGGGGEKNHTQAFLILCKAISLTTLDHAK